MHIYIYVVPIGSMYGIYANIGGILMVNVTNIAYMDPMGYETWSKLQQIFPKFPFANEKNWAIKTDGNLGNKNL